MIGKGTDVIQQLIDYPGIRASFNGITPMSRWTMSCLVTKVKLVGQVNELVSVW